MTTQIRSQSDFLARWATYLQERFPPLQYAVALSAFTWAALAYALAVHGEAALPGLHPFSVGFAVTFLVFLQLRVLDEFKDYADDARYRPYRPVPRGLVSLRSLARLWLAAAVVQIVLAGSLGLWPLALLLAVLAYSGLMRVEFFFPAWLKAHPFAYMASHMVIVPMIAAFVMACSGVPLSAVQAAPFLAMSYLNFSVFELGRKIGAPREERTGVETYSALWGPRRAVHAWLAALWAAGAAGFAAALLANVAIPYLVLASALALAATVVAVRFLSRLDSASGKIFRTMAGVWLLGVHLVIGAGVATAA